MMIQIKSIFGRKNNNMIMAYKQFKTKMEKKNETN